ncbi:hypothetical protein MBLNU457_3161t1 [Dothideomycetes sp. NU457]
MSSTTSTPAKALLYALSREPGSADLDEESTFRRRRNFGYSTGTFDSRAKVLEPSEEEATNRSIILTSSSGFDSVHAWKLFATVCEFTHLDVNCFRVNISEFHEYHGAFSRSIARLSSPTCAWVTVITLSHLDGTFTQADLVDLGRLPNLIALELEGLPFSSTHPIDLNDRLAMHLGRRADERGFPRLRALFMSGSVELTGKCFFHLNKLPALTLLSLLDSRRREPRLDASGMTTWKILTDVELERIVVIQEDRTFPFVSEERLVMYREDTPMWIRYASSVADQIGPKPQLNLTLLDSTLGKGIFTSVYDLYPSLGVKHFLKTTSPDVEKNRLKQSPDIPNAILKRPTSTSKGRQIRGSKVRKIEDALF